MSEPAVPHPAPDPELAVQVEQLRLALDVQRLTLQRLQGDLAALRAGQLDLDLALPPAWCWRDLDPAAATDLWTELADWVGWLHRRYPLADVLPACWWRHPELVEELTAAHAAWQAAYQTPGASPTGPAEWHDRWLPGLEHRLRTRWKTGRCLPVHTDRQPAAHGHPIDDPDAYQAQTGSGAVDDRDVITEAEMAGLLRRGAATRLTSLPEGPLRYAGAYWAPDPRSGWRRVTDPELVARLDADTARLAAADHAVAAITP